MDTQTHTCSAREWRVVVGAKKQRWTEAGPGPGARQKPQGQRPGKQDNGHGRQGWGEGNTARAHPGAHSPSP